MKRVSNPSRTAKKSKFKYCSLLCGLFTLIPLMIAVGVLVTVIFIHRSENGIYRRNQADKLQDVPLKTENKNGLGNIFKSISMESSPKQESPNWHTKFWTPISIAMSSDPIVYLCKLDFESYAKAPHSFGMFKALVSGSDCRGENTKTERLSVLKTEMEQSNRTLRNPSGFVFHESRVGSTLVANMLASDPFSMVFSESEPPSTVLMNCVGCTRERQISIFRDVVMLMGLSPIHKRYFFKFQSITVTQISIALEAFPDVPWVFVYRNSVQTIMSHLDPAKSTLGAVCLRSKRQYPDKIKAILEPFQGEKDVKRDEAWCAAHLNMLCLSALAALDKYGTYSGAAATGKPSTVRGFLVNYEALPGIMASVVLPRLFGVSVTSEWLQKMRSEAAMYSKGFKRPSGGGFLRQAGAVFLGDSKDKETRATEHITHWADAILGPSYDRMEQASRHSVNVLKGRPQRSDALNWTLWASIPDSPIQSQTESVVTSDYTPWNPFSSSHSSVPFETFDCPLVPDPDYPRGYPIMDVLNNWNPDNTEIPAQHYDSLCHFDFQTEQHKALAYRKAEKPFIVYNHPEMDAAVQRWGNLDYLKRRIGHKKYRTEISENNHFMYFRPVRNAEKRFKDAFGRPWRDPVQVREITFDSFLKAALKGQNKSVEEREHIYFRVTAESSKKGTENNWVFDELPFFQPKESLFMVTPRDQRGIHCRFGMRGVIAEAHYDGSRNAVAELGGLRRWVMAHPNQCKDLYLLPREHPSGRHSEVNWSSPDLVKYPKFSNAQANEVILKPGDILYVPTEWFHFIVSLNLNYQCNTRSGISSDYEKVIHACGF